MFNFVRQTIDFRRIIVIQIGSESAIVIHGRIDPYAVRDVKQKETIE